MKYIRLKKGGVCELGYICFEYYFSYMTICQFNIGDKRKEIHFDYGADKS